MTAKEIEDDLVRRSRERNAVTKPLENKAAQAQEPRHRVGPLRAFPSPQPKVVTQEVAVAPQVELVTLAALYKYPKRCFPVFADRGRQGFFSNPIYRSLFDILEAYFVEHRHADPTSFLQHLIDVGHLEKLGGPGLIGELAGATSPPESFMYHLDILRDKYVAREAARLSYDLAGKVGKAGHDELWTVIGEHERAISDLRVLATDKLEGVENFAYVDLINFDSANDDSVLLGQHRWLGCGYTCLWAGGSGYGKSTLVAQGAFYWGAGVPLFGIRPARPLKSLIIQAENDLGDTAEQFQGVVAGIKATGDVNLNGEVERMVVVVRLVGCTGDAFLRKLRALLKLHKPDLVWIDPLFAFAGCDLLNTEAVSRFLREGLIPIAIEHGVCAHVIHHIGKPARDNNAKREWTSFDYQFLGFGSSEIQNAFRAVNILIPVSGHEGIFRLFFPSAARELAPEM